MNITKLLIGTLVFGLNLAFFQSAYAQLSTIQLKKNDVVEVKGDLSTGALMDNLRWAWNSSVACFPETQSKKFTGNHVLYSFDLPSYSEVEITVEPDDKNANFSLYAYVVGQVNDNNIVPNLSSCIRCEADHKWDYKRRGKVQDHTRTVKDILAIRNPYQVVVGVVGAEGLAEGTFSLRIKSSNR